MITNFKLYEYINNKDLVKTTINNTLKKIIKINGGDINFHKNRSDDLVLVIQFEIIEKFKKQVDNEIGKLKNQLKKSGTFISYKSHTQHQMKFKDDDDMFDFEIDYDKPNIEQYYLHVKDTHYNRAKPPRYLFHKTKHKNYRNIIENGLEVRGNENYKNEPYYDHPEGIYASSEKDFFGYSNDDEWRIDTTKIDNKWWRDYNLYDKEQQKKSFLTYEPIPIEAIELIKSQY